VNALSRRLNRAARGDDGLTLVEVLVAMMIFAVVSLGVAYSLVMTVQISSDARGRQTASNVAASTIDRMRSIANFSDVGPSTSTVSVNGRNYFVTVTTNIVGANGGASSQCSSGSGAPVYKSVNVDVSWQGMSSKATPVQADTAVAPSARLNDPNLGVIVTSVKTATGAGNQGVTVKAVPDPVTPNGARSIVSTISPTDAQGCSVVFGVSPGNYIVSISETLSGNPSIDSNQSLTPSFPVTVSAGGSATAPFQFDQASLFQPTFTSVGAIVPPGMPTSFSNTYATWTRSASPFYLHPYTTGYFVIAGSLAANGGTASNCLSVDPGNWPLSADGMIVGTRQPAVATAPGGVAPASVPVGIVQIDTSVLNAGYIKAVAQTTGPGGTDDPGCASPSTYVIPIPTPSTSTTIALPFGSWAFYAGNSASQTNTVGNGVTVITRGSVAQASGASIATLDPRNPVVP